MSIINSVLAIARGEIGVREQGGNNRGQRVEEYLSAVGLGPGNPWCAAFVSWCLQQASVKGAPCTGDTWALEAWGAQHDALYNENANKPEKPMVGDIFLLLGSDNRPRHTGFVTAVNGDHVATIEGNTGTASDTDGDGVAAKTRRVYDCSFVRWAQVCTEYQASKRVLKIFRKPTRAVVVVDGKEYPCTSLSINGKPAEAGAEISIIAEY